MCAICVEIAKGHITYKEAKGAIVEAKLMSKSDDEFMHIDDLSDALEEGDSDYIEAIVEEGQDGSD